MTVTHNAIQEWLSYNADYRTRKVGHANGTSDIRAEVSELELFSLGMDEAVG